MVIWREEKCIQFGKQIFADSIGLILYLKIIEIVLKNGIIINYENFKKYLYQCCTKKFNSKIKKFEILLISETIQYYVILLSSSMFNKIMPTCFKTCLNILRVRQPSYICILICFDSRLWQETKEYFYLVSQLLPRRRSSHSFNQLSTAAVCGQLTHRPRPWLDAIQREETMAYECSSRLRNRSNRYRYLTLRNGDFRRWFHRRHIR